MNPSPISRNGEPVENGRIVDPAILASAGAGADMPPTDFLAMVKANDPHNDTTGSQGIVSRAGADESAPETNTEINKVLKKMPSQTEHAVAEKAVGKEPTGKEAIAEVVERVKQLRKAVAEIDQVEEKNTPAAPAPQPISRAGILARIRERMRTRLGKVDGAIVDPVKGSEDAGKTPEESVKSIKTTKAEAKDRPLSAVPEGKMRYSPDKGNAVRDQEAKDALSQGKKDEGKYMKEPSKERPVTRKASLAAKLAALNVYAESDSTWRKENNFPMKQKYPIEKSPDMDFEGAASATEKVISKEHGERAKEKGDITPMKTTLWSDQSRKKVGGVDKATIKKQIEAYTSELKSIKGEDAQDLRKLEVLENSIATLEDQMQKLSYVPMVERAPKDMSWEEIIKQGNAIYADIQRILSEVDGTVSPFLSEVGEKVAAMKAQIKTAKEDGDEEPESKDKDEDKGEDKDEKGEKEPKEKSKGKGKKDKTEDVAEETIDLLKDIRDTAKEMSEDVDEHLEMVEKETGIPVPAAGEGLPGLPGEEGLPGGMEGLPPMGPEGGEGLPPMGEPGMEKMMSWIGKMPKTAVEEEEIVRAIVRDPNLTPDDAHAEIKKLRKLQNWKAVFTKIAAESACPAAIKKPADKKLEEEIKKDTSKAKTAEVDRKNSFWSVYRGDELVLRASVEDLYKEKAEEAFDWASSREYGEKLLASVLYDGLHVTGSRLGIESMVKVGKEKGGLEKLDPKAYYKKVYPASYVTELFKEHKKKADLQMKGLQDKVGQLEEENTALKQTCASLEENQVLHAKAEKAISLVKMAVEKGLVDNKEFDNVVDGLMLSNDEGFDTFSSMVAKAPTAVKKASIDEKIDMVRTASEKKQTVALDKAIVIQNQGGGGMETMATELGKLWKTPPTQPQK